MKNEKGWCVEERVGYPACLGFRVPTCGSVVWEMRLEKQAELNCPATSVPSAIPAIQALSHVWTFVLDVSLAESLSHGRFFVIIQAL